MILRVNKTDLIAMGISVRGLVTVGSQKEAEMKPNSAEFKVLQVTREIETKINYVGEIINKLEQLGSENPESDLELNRSQAKALIATMVHTTAIQAKVYGEYEKRPEDHPSFGPEVGRRKQDYMGRLKERMDEVGAVIEKIKGAL